ncbi:MAG: hypothetical protein LBT53_05940, partial [Puniceicoccales bacterium]|nr:hypothetical protein [Puniceicoccales bacterium]
MEHAFTLEIKSILQKTFGDIAKTIFEKSLLLNYLNEKTRSAERGSKSRGAFANLYAIFVLLEDYLKNGFDKKDGYTTEYEGAVFGDLSARQRQLPFGEKLQNHALNNRVNAEFLKFFPNSESIPILRNLDTNRYWFNENLLKIEIENTTYNIAAVVIQSIDKYIEVKQHLFLDFIKKCEELQSLKNKSSKEAEDFISSLLAPNVDARLFEIVSYAILKSFYHDQKIYWGFSPEHLQAEQLQLYKTGRTNANDGGIDFVMRPLGRFFQVTETLDFKKYFL